MEGLYADLADFLKRPALLETAVDILLCAVPIWVAVMLGLVIGWSWRPRWTGLVFLGLRSKLRFLCAPPGFGARRLWFAFTAFSALSVCRRLWTNFKGKGDGEEGEVTTGQGAVEAASSSPGAVAGGGRTAVDGAANGHSNCELVEGDQEVITRNDLDHLVHLLEDKVGDSVWQHLMERTTSNMSYQAWRHEPEVGPIMYRSRTVFEDATPELVRDFFWDDEFRLKWDPMLAHFKVLEEFSQTGEMIVHWIKKFPFFCSDREYIIGRRIWESGKTYYCVTKGVPYPALCKKEKPRRVEMYFSSWRIRAVESRRQDGQLTACEVTLVHYEDMGIPKDVAKVGVRHGMWGAVKKLQSGMRAYQLARKSDMLPSRTALMARNITIFLSDPTICLTDCDSSQAEENSEGCNNKLEHSVDWKWVFLGGTVAVVCGLQTGILGKALLLGAARRLQRK